MHFTLVTAPTITEFRSAAELESAAVQQAALVPQLGVLNVAAVLERLGDTPEILDSNGAYMRLAASSGAARVDDFADALARQAVLSNADVYGLSTICSTFPLTLRIARAIKQLRPYCTILLGGPQASVVDSAVIEAFPFVDFVLRGEVEHSLPLFFNELHRDYDFARVPGLTFRDGTVVHRTPAAPAIDDLDSLPSPAYHLANYLQGATSASIELGRGCPFACTFCSTNDFFRRRFRLRSPERVLGEMRDLNRRYGVRHFELVHDMFTVDRKRVVAFCEHMAASGEPFTWDCSARTDCVDEDLLQQMAASGCRGVFFGIETGSRRMQRIIDKDLDPDKAERMLQCAESVGMTTTASLITGFPEERWEDLRDTLRIYMRSARCSGSRPQINLLAPLAGTPIHTQHRHEMELEELCSDMSHQGLSQGAEELSMILARPDIFPNFYMIPAPFLDRHVLFELREFLSMSVEVFRRTLCAIASQADLLDFHGEWRAWRESVTGPLVGSELRRFYLSPQFRTRFPEFLEQHPMRQNPLVNATLLAERALRSASAKIGAAALPSSVAPGFVAPGLPLFEDDVAVLPDTTTILRLNCDLDDLEGAAPDAGSKEFCYATRLHEDRSVHLHRIDATLGALLKLCDGRSIADLVPAFASSLEGTPPEVASALGRPLIAGAHQAGWLQIRREPSPATRATQLLPRSSAVAPSSI